MLLRKLRLRNFRQFRGEQCVTFSTDPVRNVTVIMGENGSGKTSLAQAFTWSLYGDTDFEDKFMLCKAIVPLMPPNAEEVVRVELELTHKGTEYTITREQRYAKDEYGSMKRPSQTVFRIAYKGPDGQQEFVKDFETEMRMQEILPRELSRYFFFDGERIGRMGKEIRGGRSKEFARAVRSLLGLSAFTAALEHLNGRGQSVIRSYEQRYDARSDSRLAEYTKEIERFDALIAEIEERLEEIESQEIVAEEKRQDLQRQLLENSESQQLAERKDRCKKQLQGLESLKNQSIAEVLKAFNSRGVSYFARPMVRDALRYLSDADKLDKGIPDMSARTVKYLIERGYCLCGARIEPGNDACTQLQRTLEYIPPQSVGSTIGQFVHDCEQQSRRGEGLYEDICDEYRLVRDAVVRYSEVEHEIQGIEDQLKGMKRAGELQAELTRYEQALRRLREEREQLLTQKGAANSRKERCETERKELALKSETNRKIEVYKAYARHMYDVLSGLYSQKEAQTRVELEQTMNDIFRTIYAGGFSLAVDEKYNIQVIVDDFDIEVDDVETGTAQGISIIFAFIAGVIKMARQSRVAGNEMLVSEPYPLVMDAPLSAFDKKRIEAVCKALPEVAEQIIIFIKDTDGELAEEHMSHKIGARYLFNKRSEFETTLVRR